MRSSKFIFALTTWALLLAGCDETREVGEPEGGIVEWPEDDPDPSHEPDEPNSPESPGEEAETCSPAPKAFAYSLCSCEGLTGAGNLTVRGGGTTGAFVGVNGYSQLAGAVDVDGSAVFHDGLSVAASLDVTGHVATRRSVDIVGTATIGGNLDIGADLSGFGSIDIGGALRVDGKESVFGELYAAQRGPFQAPPQPCGCDDLAVDVAAEVALASQSNHNEAIGLPVDVDELGSSTFHLPTGRYYLSAPRTLGSATFSIDGAVSLYIDGSFESLGSADIQLAEGATLDLYVSGSLRAVGNLAIGDEANAADVRIYVGGSESVAVAVGNQAFYGSLYAPEAYLETYGNTVIVGGAFVRGFVGAGNVDIVGVTSHDFSEDDCPPDLDECVMDPDLGGCGTPPDHVPEG